ncbi:non-homologous end-joining factor 1 [Osmerus mordax]|uniref:non-homologous end-joining factor 1 n=1 Tax=Osmerus mordax TaxID=8014 RepID=UPI0035101586
MEREARDGSDLLGCLWTPVYISGSHLLAKTWFGDTAYHILLTDLHSVWEERMDSIAIQDRAQELNRRLRAPVQAFFSHLCKVALPCLSGEQGAGVEEEEVKRAEVAHISLTRQAGDISMKLKSELAGLPFYWEFRCTLAPLALVCRQLVRPLLLMSRLLQLQVGQLEDLLVRKDMEIQDYRENGAVLSRERLQTEAFEEQSYRESFFTQALPQLRLPQGGFGFDPGLQQLYTAVTTHGNANARKRKLSEQNAQDQGDPSAQSQDPAPRFNPPPEREAGSCEPSLGENPPTGLGAQAGATEPTRPTAPQTGSDMSASSDRPASRPRKKKAVGLFR